MANGPAHKFSHRDTEGFCFFLGEHVLFRIQADLSSDHVITFCTYDNIGPHRGSDHPRGGNDCPPSAWLHKFTVDYRPDNRWTAPSRSRLGRPCEQTTSGPDGRSHGPAGKDFSNNANFCNQALAGSPSSGCRQQTAGLAAANGSVGPFHPRAHLGVRIRPKIGYQTAG